MVIKINKEEQKDIFILVILVVITRIILEYVYKTQVATIFRYSGYQNDFSVRRAIITWTMLVVIIPCVYRYVKKPRFSSMVLFLVYFINYLPGTILFTYRQVDFIIPWFIYYCMLFFVPIVLPPVKPVKGHKGMNSFSIKVMISFFSIFIVFIWLYYAHGRIYFGMDDVYSLRMEARNYGMPMALRYIFASMKITIPVIIVWCLKKKNTLYSVIFAAIQLIMYFVDGQKTTLFSLFSTVLAFYFLRNKPKRVLYLPTVIAGIGLLAIGEYKLLDSYKITTVIIRRVMFVPQSLNIPYYDFFTHNTPDFFRNSVLKVFGFSSPYGGIARMIGRVYMGNESVAANNGFFSDAYANLGLIGIFIMPIAIVLLLRVLDCFSFDLSVDFLIGAVVTFTIPLMSSSFFTLFLSHGVIALSLIFYFLPRESDSSEKLDDKRGLMRKE